MNKRLLIVVLGIFTLANRLPLRAMEQEPPKSGSKHYTSGPQHHSTGDLKVVKKYLTALSPERWITRKHPFYNIPTDCLIHKIVPFIVGDSPNAILAWAERNNCLVKQTCRDFKAENDGTSSLKEPCPITNIASILAGAAKRGSLASLKFIALSFPSEITNVYRALYNAITNNDFTMVRAIVNNLGHLITRANKAIAIAIKNDNRRISKYLLRHCKNKITNIDEALANAAKNGNVQILRLLLTRYIKKITDVSKALNGAAKNVTSRLTLFTIIRLLKESCKDKISREKLSLEAQLKCLSYGTSQLHGRRSDDKPYYIRPLHGKRSHGKRADIHLNHLYL